MNVVSPVPPSIPPPTMSLSNMNGKPKLTMTEVDTPAEPTGQAQPQLLLYPNGHLHHFPLKNQEPLLSSQIKNQDKNVTSTNSAHINRIMVVI